MSSFLQGWAIVAIIYIGFVVSYRMGIAILDHKYFDAFVFEIFYIATVALNILVVFEMQVVKDLNKKKEDPK